jgi:hypothetical protein
MKLSMPDEHSRQAQAVLLVAEHADEFTGEPE